jgi:hypothetical protein
LLRLDEIGEIMLAVRTENVAGLPDSAAKAFVGAGGVSLADAESLIAFLMGGK